MCNQKNNSWQQPYNLDGQVSLGKTATFKLGAVYETPFKNTSLDWAIRENQYLRKQLVDKSVQKEIDDWKYQYDIQSWWTVIYVLITECTPLWQLVR